MSGRESAGPPRRRRPLEHPAHHHRALHATRQGDTLQYTATIDDPGTWTRPWTRSFPWKREAVYGMFEYACHEGNYAMRNMLSASRAEEKGSK